LPWIVIGDFETRLDEVIQLMKLGASDVLMESRGPPEVAAAASAALSIHKVSTASRAPRDARQKIAQLSRREREVLDGLAAGLTNKAIAQKLLLSPRTVETHRAHLMDRLGVSSLAELLKLTAEAALDGMVKKV
jgi:FixJ family two-component response regulator